LLHRRTTRNATWHKTTSTGNSWTRHDNSLSLAISIFFTLLRSLSYVLLRIYTVANVIVSLSLSFPFSLFSSVSLKCDIKKLKLCLFSFDIKGNYFINFNYQIISSITCDEIWIFTYHLNDNQCNKSWPHLQDQRKQWRSSTIFYKIICSIASNIASYAIKRKLF